VSIFVNLTLNVPRNNEHAHRTGWKALPLWSNLHKKERRSQVDAPSIKKLRLGNRKLIDTGSFRGKNFDNT
jgi:hypothetical protein